MGASTQILKAITGRRNDLARNFARMRESKGTQRAYAHFAAKYEVTEWTIRQDLNALGIESRMTSY